MELSSLEKKEEQVKKPKAAMESGAANKPPVSDLEKLEQKTGYKVAGPESKAPEKKPGHVNQTPEKKQDHTNQAQDKGPEVPRKTYLS